MPQLLDSHLDHFATQLKSLGATVDGKAVHQLDLEDAVALAVSLFDLIDQHAEKVCGTGADWKEDEARAMVPIYMHWFDVAQKLKSVIQDAKAATGSLVANYGDFAHRLNRAKIARDFESNLAQSKALEAGTLKTRPLEEVMDELQRRINSGS
jgi:hypothetical protein